MLARKSFAIFFWVVSLFALMYGGVFVWAIKDGLGPESVESHGSVAVIRFCTGMAWIVGIYVIPPLLVGCILYPWRSRRQ